MLATLGWVVAPDDWVFGHIRTKDAAPTTSQALHARLKRAVAVQGAQRATSTAPRDLTLHSFRRVTLQHEAYVHHWHHDELMQLSAIKDSGVLMRHIDQGRHLA